MSQIYGKPSRYLILNDLFYFLKEKFIIIIGILLILILLQYSKLISSITSLIIFVVILLIIKNYIEIKSKIYRKISDKFHHGAEGEHDIYKELKKLPHDYLVFRDIKLPNIECDLDFVVICPTGVYAVEVKSHKGNIGYDGQQLTRDGKVFEKDFLKQTIFEAMSLREFIKEKSGKEIFTHAVLVFSSPYASLRFGFNPINNVIVIGRKFLLEYFSKQPPRFNEIEINTLKEILMPLIKG